MAAFNHLFGQEAEPDLDLVHPGGVLGCVVKDHRLVWLGEKRLAGGHRLQEARLAFYAQFDIQPTEFRGGADQGFGLVRVELVQDEMIHPVAGVELDHPLDKAGEVRLGACVSDPSTHLAGGDLEGGDQGLGAVASVLELHGHRLAGRHRQVRSQAFQGLNRGHLVGAHDQFVGAVWRLLVEGADVRDPFVLPGVGRGVEPVAEAMGVQRFFWSTFRKWPAESRSTIPCLMASAANSRPLQWVVG